MKPIYGIDITSNKNNETFNGSEFITNTSSQYKLEAVESRQENLLETVEKCKLPLWVRIAKWICGIYALLVIAGLVKAAVDFEQAFSTAPWLIFSGIACGLIWLALQIFSKIKEKRVMAEEGVDQQIEDIDVDVQDIYNELNVPDNADTVDVLLFKYKIKNGEIVPKALGFQTTPYSNLEVKIYIKDDDLCLADLETVYSFKLSELRAIKTVNKRISIPTWNKEEKPTKGEFKKYKMSVNDMEDVFFKPYHILEIDHYGEIFGIYFPCYELATFEKLTGLKAEY